MENRRNYYRILQVQPGAPVEIIRASYRTLMQRLKAHPDLGGDHWNAALINEAYAVLTDPAKRAQYDRELQARVRSGRSGSRPETSDGNGEAEIECLFCGAAHQMSPNLHVNADCSRCRSPLHRATLKRLAVDGRRAINRLPRNHSLLLYKSWRQAQGFKGESRDVSLNGISFVTSELIPPQAVIKLESEFCRAVIQVGNMRVDDDGADGLWLVGAQFLSVIFPRARGGFLSAEA